MIFRDRNNHYPYQYKGANRPARIMTETIRHDWYQTDEKVVITVLMKNITDCSVDIQPDRVLLAADEKTLDLQLCKEIDVSKSSHKRSPVKMEITLTKKIGERWPSLVADKDEAAATAAPKVTKIYKQDWESLQKEIEKEEEEKGEVSSDGLRRHFFVY